MMKQLHVVVLFSLAMLTSGLVEADGIFSNKRPAGLGIQANGQLKPAPATPNAVSSEARPGSYAAIEPLHIEGKPSVYFRKLKAAIVETDNATIILATPTYIYAEYTSPVMGFVDDVEFLLRPKVGVVEVRSASRMGVSDLGSNRRRIEKLRAQVD